MSVLLKTASVWGANGFTKNGDQKIGRLLTLGNSPSRTPELSLCSYDEASTFQAESLLQLGRLSGLHASSRHQQGS